ncbi:MAG TPA: restriction endonuclease fold toxin-2 domain-containing protein [Archangium sp.]|nr:restriction endonuclease fold toxin-2 domain-containing protein [Archangium sp.]
MKGIAFCLCLLLAVPAAANSLDDALCRTTSLKLCRSFAQALATLPAAMTQEAQALLTPETLAVMGTLTAAWAGSQGVLIVGQAVDAALLSLGVTLLISEAGVLGDCLWRYVNLATAARSKAELDEASAYLARALSLVGINVVAFILTKKVMAKAPRGPPSAPGEFALPQGGSVAESVIGRASSASPASSVRAPALLMAGGPGREREPSEREEYPAKKPDPASFGEWIQQAERRPLPVKPEEPYGFQRRHAGAEELLVKGGGEKVWADGARARDAHLIETKYVEKPDTSPFVIGSTCDDSVRQLIRKKEANQFSRYAAVILDPKNPAVGLEVVVNDSRAVAFFEALLREFRIPGRVVVGQ